MINRIQTYFQPYTMKNNLNLALCAFVLLLMSCSNSKLDARRISQSFNQDWVFQKGETGLESQSDFDDSTWRKLELPHDWAIEGPFDKKHDARTGGLPIYGTA